jgi:hypothetical protein
VPSWYKRYLCIYIGAQGGVLHDWDLFASTRKVWNRRSRIPCRKQPERKQIGIRASHAAQAYEALHVAPWSHTTAS